MNARPDNWRKAAILVSVLDHAQATVIGDSLSPREADQLRQAVDQLGEVSAAEQHAVLAEFLGRGLPPLVDATGGVELDDDLARRLAGIGAFEPTAAGSASRGDSWTCPELTAADPAALCRCLTGEQPQIVATILAQLPAATAARVLAGWPARHHAELLQRIANLAPVPPDLLDELQHELVVRLRGDAARQQSTRAREATVEAILAAADERLSGWRSGDYELDPPAIPRFLDEPDPVSDDGVGDCADALEAEHVGAMVSPPTDQATARGPTLDWGDLRQWDDESLVTVLAAGPPESVRLALAGADPELVQRIRRHLGPRAARRLDGQLQRLEAVRIADIVEAQRQLGELASHLLATGAVRPGRN